jgi:succinyl-CoA synthetase beta subunit/citryl-CoA synthetase large subunit
MQHQARELISQAGIHGRPLLALGSVMASLADIFLRYDCTILEINPLVVLSDGKVMALDCHADIEDDALFRHPEIAALDNEKGR